MSWLSRVRSGIPFLPKRQSAENLWHKCKKCGTMVFTKEWEDNLMVCPRCDYHDRIGWRVRFDQVFDDGEYDVLPSPEVREDPLRFRDSKRYSERIKAARDCDQRPRRTDQRKRRGRGQTCRDRRPGLRLHGRIDGHCRRRGLRRRRSAGDRRQVPLRHLHGGRRRSDAGRHPLADANAQDDGRPRRAQGSRPALHRHPDRPHDRRRHGFLCHARRRPDSPSPAH